MTDPVSDFLHDKDLEKQAVGQDLCGIEVINNTANILEQQITITKVSKVESVARLIDSSKGKTLAEEAERADMLALEIAGKRERGGAARLLTHGKSQVCKRERRGRCRRDTS